MSELLTGPIWLIGCGNMAGAMLDGWLAAGINPRLITVVRPSGKAPADGIRTLTSPPDNEVPALVLLGVKPQKLDEVAPALERAVAPETILLSILAGVEVEALRCRFPAVHAIVRAMPNLPIRLRQGVTPLYIDGASKRSAATTVERLIRALGTAEWFEDESAFALAGHLTAAAPAFLFRFISALADAAAALGLPADQAERLAAQMAAGAAALAAQSGETPAALARRVASPGGTTEAGLRVLDGEEGLKPLVREALEASRRRGEEMAQTARRGTD